MCLDHRSGSRTPSRSVPAAVDEVLELYLFFVLLGIEDRFTSAVIALEKSGSRVVGAAEIAAQLSREADLEWLSAAASFRLGGWRVRED